MKWVTGRGGQTTTETKEMTENHIDAYDVAKMRTETYQECLLLRLHGRWLPSHTPLDTIALEQTKRERSFRGCISVCACEREKKNSIVRQINRNGI